MRSIHRSPRPARIMLGRLGPRGKRPDRPIWDEVFDTLQAAGRLDEGTMFGFRYVRAGEEFVAMPGRDLRWHGGEVSGDTGRSGVGQSGSGRPGRRPAEQAGWGMWVEGRSPSEEVGVLPGQGAQLRRRVTAPDVTRPRGPIRNSPTPLARTHEPPRFRPSDIGWRFYGEYRVPTARRHDIGRLRLDQSTRTSRPDSTARKTSVRSHPATPTTTASTAAATTPSPATGSSTTRCCANAPTPSADAANWSTSSPGPTCATPIAVHHHAPTTRPLRRPTRPRRLTPILG